jgi:two-component system response regulator YesN
MFPKILLVDDEENIRKAIGAVAEMATEGRVELHEAKDGKEAQQMLERTRYALVMLDWSMPRMGGSGLLDYMNSRNLLPQTQVLVISGAMRSAQAGLILEAGAKAFVEKPFDIDELSSLILGSLKAAA